VRCVKGHVHRLVVVDDDNVVQGIVSLSDILHYLVLAPLGQFCTVASVQNVFQYGVRPPYLICCEVIILHPEAVFYVPDFVLNFRVDWFSTF